MPYRFESEKMRIPTRPDRRRKLTDEQREQAVQMHRSGMSERRIARMFGVSRNTIRLIVSPSYRESSHRYNSRHWRVYAERYKAMRNERMTEHRHYKQELAKAGLLEKMEEEKK